MSSYNFKLSISPKEALRLVKEQENADLVYEENNVIDDDREIGILVFEKYYMRASNRAALTVIIDNIKGETVVRSISTGSSQGWLFNFDWGASDDFAYSVQSILEKYIIE